MPIGALIARYLKVFKSADPAWFYVHVSCQAIAYIVGVARLGIGQELGSESTSIQYDAHRIIHDNSRSVVSYFHDNFHIFT